MILWLYPEVTRANTKVFITEQQTGKIGNTRAKDSLQIITLLNHGLREIEDNNSPQANSKFFSAFKKAIQLARKSGLLVMTGNKMNRIGIQLRHEAHYSLALWLFNQSVEIGKETGNTKLLLFSYNNLGVVFRKIDNYQKALDYHLKALRLATQINDSASMAMAVNSIGNVYFMMGDNGKALHNFKQSLQLEQSRNNPIGIAINLNNIAHVYEEKGLLTKALKYFELSLEINRNIHSTRGIAICSNDIAEVLKKQGKYHDALIFSKSALRKAKEIKDYDNLANAYIKTGELYSALKDYENAFQYLYPGIKLAKKIHARSILEEAYNALFNTYMKMKKYQKAIVFLQLKQAYHDSLLNLDVRKSVARMQIQFDIERQQSQMQLQQQKTKIAMLQLKKQKYMLYFAWSAFTLLLIILIFLSFYLYDKNKKNLLLKEKNKEIEKAQEALRKSNDSLVQAIEKAENSARVLSAFLANMSHEIRTPLNSVIGFSDLLSSMITDKKQRDYLKAIKSSGESLLVLINDILDISKIEEGNINLELKNTDIRQIIDDVMIIFDIEASHKNLRLETSIDDNFPQFILFDEARLRQILFNIIGNAIKFTQQGGVSISVHSKQEKGSEKITLIIEVADTGPGIPPEEQDIIFAPFQQGKTSQKAKGAGLGLSISQRLANAMNGEIVLESTPGKGSLFSLIFHDVEVRTPVITASTDAVPVHKTNKKCLFIHQPNPMGEGLRQIFVSHGFGVEDVGLNLSKARHKIAGFRLVVFCCLEEEILQNARNIFEKENIDKQHVFLILNINRSFHIDETKAFNIQLFNQSASEIESALREFLRQFDEDECARRLFSLRHIENEQLFYNKISHLYHTYFEPALNTKMFDKIGLFAQNLRQIAMEYEQPNLIEFTNDLNHYLKTFDIIDIEKQLGIFKKAFEITFSKE